MSTLRHSALVSTHTARSSAYTIGFTEKPMVQADTLAVRRNIRVGFTENLAATFADSLTRLRARTMAVSDMSEYSVGVAADDWTQARWVAASTITGADPIADGDVTSVSTKKLDWYNNTTARKASSWNETNNFTDGDILMLMDHPTSGAVNSLSGTAFRGSGGSGTEQGYVVYKSSTQVLLAKYIAGTRSTIVAVAMAEIGNARPLWWRINVSGTAIKVKFWDYNCYEPTTWQIDTTDADIAGPGWVGIHSAATTTLALYYAAVSFNAAAPYDLPSTYIPNKNFGAMGQNVYPAASGGNLVRLQGGYFSVGSRNMVGCDTWWAGTHSSRWAVYSGGTETDPTGATLLYDFGYHASSTTYLTFDQLNCSPIAIPQNTWLWVAAKWILTSRMQYTTEIAASQNLSPSGSNTPVTMSTDPTQAFPDTIPETGTFGSVWYQVRIRTEVAGSLTFAATDNLNTWADSASILQTASHITVQVSDDLNQFADTAAIRLRFHVQPTEALGSYADTITVVLTGASTTPITVSLAESWGLLSDSAQANLLARLTASITDTWGLLNDSIQTDFKARVSASLSDSWNLLSDSAQILVTARVSVALTDTWGLLGDTSDAVLGLRYTLSDTMPTPADSVAHTITLTYGQFHTLLLIKDLVEIEGRAGWMYDHYNPGIVSHYGEEGANIHSMLCGGADGSIYQLTGLTDASYPIPCEILTKALDQSDPRNQKLYGDIMVDGITQSADVTAVLGFDNNTIQTAPYIMNTATRQQIPIPAGSPWRTARNICLSLNWRQSGTPAYFYIWEPRFTEESNNLYAYSWSTAYLTHGIKGYFIHGYLYLQHTATGDVTFSIIDEDGVVAAAVLIPFDIGYTQKQFLRLPTVKGKFFKYTVSSSVPFRLDGDNSELLVRPWGSSEPWQRKRIFKDVSRMGSSNDQVLSNTQ
jgi:hypothetical protein